jgi:hypothetical protein
VDKGRTNKSTSLDKKYLLSFWDCLPILWPTREEHLWDSLQRLLLPKRSFLDLLVLEPVSLSITKKSGIMLEQLTASSIQNSLMPLLDGRSYFQ